MKKSITVDQCLAPERTELCPPTPDNNNKPGLIPLILLILLIFTCTTGAVAHAGEGIRAESLKGIYANDNPTELEKKSIDQLQKGLKKIFGITLPLLESPPQAGENQPVVIIGRQAALASARLTEKAFEQLPADGFMIQSDSSGVVIAGNNAWATLDGIYHFLEKAGMQFFNPRFNKAKVPLSQSGQIPRLNLTMAPDFAFRSGRSLVWNQMYYRMGDPGKGLDPELFDKKITGSDLWIDHTAGYLVPKRLFHESHPEYYAQIDGRRIAADRFTDHRTPLCLSNPAVAEISAERALGWIEKERDKSHFMITYGDTGVWCECSNCRKLDEVPGVYTDRLLAWVNAVAKVVGEKYPDKILMTFAYGGTDTPPLREKPSPNVWIVGSTGLGNIPFWDHARKAGDIPRHHLNKLDGWLEKVPDRMTVCEYQSNTYKPALVDTLQARLKFYKDRGVRGIVFTFGLPQNFRGLWEYLYSHLMWDLDQDPMKLAGEYIDFHFKQAAPHIRQVIALSHERYKDTQSREPVLKDKYPEGFYAPDFTAAVSKAFEKAALAVHEDQALLEEIQKEETCFIHDWMKHPSYTRLDDQARQLLNTQLDRLLILAGPDETKKEKLGRTLHRLALAADEEYEGTLDIVESWIISQKLHVPVYEKTSTGVILPPEAFRFAGYGPSRYGYHCPPRDAVGVYVKENSRSLSHRMVAEFEWDLPLSPQAGLTLELTGQIASDIIKPKIRIILNDTEIYSGSADFVSNNWSRQSHTIPAKSMKTGLNIMEIQNISHPLTTFRWNQRWCLISNAEISITEK